LSEAPNKEKGTFYWFDVINDIEVTKAIRKVYELGKHT
jgi:hypothetical protein